MHRPVIGHNSACYRDGHKCLCVNGQPYVPKAEYVSMSRYPGHRPCCFIYDGKCYCESSRPWFAGFTAHDGKVLSPQEVVQLYRSNLLPYKGNILSKPSEKTYSPTRDSQKVDTETCLKDKTLQKWRLDSEHPSVQPTQQRTAQSLHLQLQVTTSQKMIEPQKSETEQYSVQQSQLSVVQSEVQQAKSSIEQSATQQPKDNLMQSEVERARLSIEQIEQVLKPGTEQHIMQQPQKITHPAMQQSGLDKVKLERDLKKPPGRIAYDLYLNWIQKNKAKNVQSEWKLQQQRECMLSMQNQNCITNQYECKEHALAKRTKDRQETHTDISGDWLSKLSLPNDATAKVVNTHESDEVLPRRNNYMDLEFPDSRLLYPYAMQYPGVFINKPQQHLDLRNWPATSMVSHFPNQMLNYELLSGTTSSHQNPFLQQNGFYHPHIQTVQLP